MIDTWTIENTEHAIAMEQSRSTAISINNQVCELQQSIEQGNRANAKAQAIEIDRLRDENARMREALERLTERVEMVGRGVAESVELIDLAQQARAAIKGE
jgi:hypothetical protein